MKMALSCTLQINTNVTRYGTGFITPFLHYKIIEKAIPAKVFWKAGVFQLVAIPNSGRSPIFTFPLLDPKNVIEKYIKYLKYFPQIKTPKLSQNMNSISEKMHFMGFPSYRLGDLLTRTGV